MYFVTLFILIGLSVTQIVLAAPNEFVPLVGIPYLVVPQGEELGLGNYINALYKISISVAAFLAVVKIIFAGVKYMISDIVPTKEQAKKDIRGALLGLLIVIGAVLILTTINPQLTGLDALQKIPGFSVKTGAHEGRSADQIRIEEMCKSKFKCKRDVCGFIDDSINDTCKEDCENDKNGVFTPSLLPGGVCTYAGEDTGTAAEGDKVPLRKLDELAQSRCPDSIEKSTFVISTSNDENASCMSVDEVLKKTEISSGSPVAFSVLPFTDDVMRQSRNFPLSNLKIGDVIGYLSLDITSDKGAEILSAYDDEGGYVDAILTPACGKGNKIIRKETTTGERIENSWWGPFGTTQETAHYFCVKK
ncbi:MAG: hypothetical protein ACI92I_000282 [Acidimicrobiales bacterium]|jgi:hypothetical protein